MIAGLPQVTDHLGEVSVTRLDDDRSEVAWKVNLEFSPWNPLSLSAPALVKLLKWVFQGGLEQLRGSGANTARTSRTKAIAENPAPDKKCCDLVV